MTNHKHEDFSFWGRVEQYLKQYEWLLSALVQFHTGPYIPRDVDATAEFKPMTRTVAEEVRAEDR